MNYFYIARQQWFRLQFVAFFRCGQAIIWTNNDVLSIGTIKPYFNEILIKIQRFQHKKINFNMSSVKERPFCVGLSVLKYRKCFRWPYSIIQNVWQDRAWSFGMSRTKRKN